MSAHQFDDPFNSSSLQCVLDNFSSNLDVVNDLHRVIEDNRKDPALVGNLLIAMRRYLDDFDLVHSQLDTLVKAAEQREKGGAQ